MSKYVSMTCSACTAWRSCGRHGEAPLGLGARLDIVLGSAYHNGGCLLCGADAPRGTVVTALVVGYLHFTLCAAHHNEFREKMNKLGERREI